MRALMLALITMLAACATPATEAPVSRVDHIIYAVEDLDQGIADIEARLGVRAVRGGAHPGLGTHNALISLGPHTYLEIIAPDPAQPAPAQPRPLGMDGLTGPKLVGWAANAPSLETLVSDANARGYPMFAPAPGERRTPDGALLTWRSTALEDYDFGDGVVPFFIDWGATPNPATTSPQGARLVSLRAEHSDVAAIRAALTGLGITLEVSEGAAPTLIAVIEGPRGQIELR